MEATIKVGSVFQGGFVEDITNTGVIISISGKQMFITFSECESLFGV